MMISSSISPRRPADIAGVSRSSMFVSQTSAMSAFSSLAFAVRNGFSDGEPDFPRLQA